MNLREYIKENKVTQARLADMLEVSVSYARMLLFYEKSPSKKLAVKIESVTEGHVTKEEAMFFEDYQ